MTASQADPSAADESPSADDTGTEPAGAGPDLNDMKRKFREALDRKRGAHASGGDDGARDNGKVHGPQGPAASRRSFRRKSG